MSVHACMRGSFVSLEGLEEVSRLTDGQGS